MNIKQLIQANNLTGKPAEIAAALNADTVERTNHEMQSYRAITNVYGTTFAATILGKLDAASGTNPLLKATYNAVCGGGIDFANPVTQGMIDSLVGVLFTPDEAGKLKAMGVYHISPCEANNLPAATEQSVQAALDEITRDAVKAAVDGAIDGVNQLYSLNPATTKEQAVMRFVLTLSPEKAEAIAKALEV